MHPRSIPVLIALVAAAISGCTVFPGLRVLTGEDSAAVASEDTVQTLDLVMADKSGDTDPSLIAAADRIEAANQYVDIVEVRQDYAARLLTVNLIFLPPQLENSLAGQRQGLDLLRRSVEITWAAVLPESDGIDRIRVTFLSPARIETLDHGTSFVGLVNRTFEIERAAAATYLQGTRSLQTFSDLLANGTVSYATPQTTEIYSGTPNHPLLILQAQTSR